MMIAGVMNLHHLVNLYEEYYEMARISYHGDGTRANRYLFVEIADLLMLIRLRPMQCIP